MGDANVVNTKKESRMFMKASNQLTRKSFSAIGAMTLLLGSVLLDGQWSYANETAGGESVQTDSMHPMQKMNCVPTVDMQAPLKDSTLDSNPTPRLRTSGFFGRRGI